MFISVGSGERGCRAQLADGAKCLVMAACHQLEERANNDVGAATKGKRAINIDRMALGCSSGSP